MIETLIVAAILGALSLFAMEMLDRQTRMLKTVEQKFSLQSVHAQMTTLMKSTKNCFESFKDIDIKALASQTQSDETVSAVETLKKVYHFQDEDGETEEEANPVFQIQSTAQNPKYEGIGIKKYTFSIGSEDSIEEDSLSASVTLQVSYDLGPNILGGRTQRKSIVLSLQFDEDNPTVLKTCSAASSGAQSSLTILDPLKQTEFDQLSGNEACQSIGSSCLKVISQNYASKAYGQIGIGNLCQINYNTGLASVEQGSPHSNIHSCEAKLGLFETYKVEQTAFGVTCQGIFKAFCL